LLLILPVQQALGFPDWRVGLCFHGGGVICVIQAHALHHQHLRLVLARLRQLVNLDNLHLSTGGCCGGRLVVVLGHCVAHDAGDGKALVVDIGGLRLAGTRGR